jgi:phosphoribosyl-ATP pyrophosphohydrolase/phosphoribosyl-AMP cyclohydrolase
MKIDFGKYPDQLVPAIIQDAETQRVLMLGFMNEAALAETLKEQKVVFFSRSKQRLWMKGESSGNYLLLKEILIDCDQDSLLLKVKPMGPVCHTGNDTCFAEKNQTENFLTRLEQTILDRKMHPSTQSYTSTLFEKGMNSIAQKLGEEAVELIIEAKDNNDDNFKNEAADLLFHYLVLLAARGYQLKDVVEILKNRQG